MWYITHTGLVVSGNGSAPGDYNTAPWELLKTSTCGDVTRQTTELWQVTSDLTNLPVPVFGYWAGATCGLLTRDAYTVIEISH